MGPSERETRLDRLFATLGLDRDAGGKPDSTLRPGDLARAGTQAAPAPSTEPFLPTISLGEGGPEPSSAPSADLVVGDRLGAGGMGVVHGATQRSLARQVAIKRPLDATGKGSLVAEARTMAHVEHPNVLPVHALGQDGHGLPVLVMKRIQGAALSDLVRDAEHASWPDLLARWGDREGAFIGILQAVCDALGVAHSHGIVHRDVKPENVMVGAFGEIYLLDWGIARKLGDPPSAAEAVSIVGTPGFMAPEMVLDPASVDARTDVFLLGATLHNLLTRELRHHGASFYETLAAAMEPVPVAYGAEIPEDLAALANAATSADPAKRPPDAAAFRRALVQHAQHREARALVIGAREALARASEAGLASPEAAIALSEASVCLSAARRAHAESEALARADEDHLRASIERDLLLESPQSARALASRLRSSDPAIEARIAEVEARILAAKESERTLRREREEADTSSSLFVRAVSTLAVGGVLLALGVARLLEDRELGREMSMTTVALGDAAVLALGLLVFVVFRKRFFANAGNRRLSVFMAGTFSVVFLTNATSARLGTPPASAFAYTFLMSAGWFALGALLMHRVFAAVTVLSLAWSFLIPSFPEHISTLALVAALTELVTIVLCIRHVSRASKAASDAKASIPPVR